jgi:hypothetical protein
LTANVVARGSNLHRAIVLLLRLGAVPAYPSRQVLPIAICGGFAKYNIALRYLGT